jgi:hypothetical protein
MRLSKIQWAKIVRCSALPIDARPQIERLIRHYQEINARRATYHTRGKTSDQFKKVEKQALALKKSLHELMVNSRAVSELVVAMSNNRLATIIPSYNADARRRLKGALAEVDALSAWCMNARVEFEKAKTKRGPHTIDAYSLVASLDEILEKFTGKRINRSYKSTFKDYVTMIVKIADPEIGRGTIDAAMKARISSRGNNRD